MKTINIFNFVCIRRYAFIMHLYAYFERTVILFYTINMKAEHISKINLIWICIQMYGDRLFYLYCLYALCWPQKTTKKIFLSHNAIFLNLFKWFVIFAAVIIEHITSSNHFKSDDINWRKFFTYRLSLQMLRCTKRVICSI